MNCQSVESDEGGKFQNKPTIHLFNLKVSIPILELGPFLILDNWTFPACLPSSPLLFPVPSVDLKGFVVVILSHKQKPCLDQSQVF